MSSSDQKSKNLGWKDYVAIIIAMLTTTLLPILAIILILVIALILVLLFRIPATIFASATAKSLFASA